MATPRPEPTRDEAALTIGLGPLEACTRPLSLLNVCALRSVLECLEGELLVVRGELNGEQCERNGGEDVICYGKGAGARRARCAGVAMSSSKAFCVKAGCHRLEFNTHTAGVGAHTDEGEVDYLEQPWRELITQNEPR